MESGLLGSSPGWLGGVGSDFAGETPRLAVSRAHPGACRVSWLTAHIFPANAHAPRRTDTRISPTSKKTPRCQMGCGRVGAVARWILGVRLCGERLDTAHSERIAGGTDQK